MTTAPLSEPREWEEGVTWSATSRTPYRVSNLQNDLSIRFRALLTDGRQDVRFERTVMG